MKLRNTLCLAVAMTFFQVTANADQVVGKLAWSVEELRDLNVPAPVLMKNIKLGDCLDARKRKMGSTAEWSNQTFRYRNGLERPVIQLRQTIRGHDWQFLYFDRDTRSFVRSEFIQNPGAPMQTRGGQHGWQLVGNGCALDLKR